MRSNINMEKEFERNAERYEFLHWGQKAFDNFRVVPPGNGDLHQVNLEYLAKGVLARDGVAFPDSLVGTDSHTVMINGLGVVGWGVGGIEAEAVMLGQPIYMLTPEVIGFKLTGQLAEGTTGTDLVLTVTQMLRQKGVVGKFVEFYGEALDTLPLPSKAMVAQHGSRVWRDDGLFPVRPADARLPANDRPHRRRNRAGRSLLPRSRCSGAKPDRPSRCSPTRSNWISRPWSRRWRVRNVRRTGSRCPR